MLKSQRSRIALALALVATALSAGVYAANASRTKLTADKCRELATRVSELQKDLLAFGVYNGNQAIAWSELEANDPGVDANGYVEGQDYTPLEVSNAIGGLADIATAIGTRMENLNKVISP